MFRSQHIAVTGFQIADTDSTVDKDVRGNAIPAFATLGDEKNAGYGNWQIMRPGDPANMFWWALDPNGPPTRGAVAGSYSYAMPALKVEPSLKHGISIGIGALGKASGGGLLGLTPQAGPKPGQFLPQRVHGVIDTDYESLDIEEAGPKDWLVVATVGHGSRQKIAFRHGGNPLLIADHRSQIAPDLSSIVHDGRGRKHDEFRKAGLHTFWEVRHWAVPGSQGTSSRGTSSVPPATDEYSLAWVGDASPDGTGYCRIGFGNIDGLGSHMVSGPFIASLDKHWLADTLDGPIRSLALSTNSYFRGSGNPFSAPLDFEEKPYPNPADSTFEYKVFLYYDANKDHPHILGQKPGMWRWFTRIPIGETPKCTPTKDYSTSDSNSNPVRTYAEDSRAFIQKKVISTGIYFMPRVNLEEGRVADLEVEGGVI